MDIVTTFLLTASTTKRDTNPRTADGPPIKPKVKTDSLFRALQMGDCGCTLLGITASQTLPTETGSTQGGADGRQRHTPTESDASHAPETAMENSSSCA